MSEEIIRSLLDRYQKIEHINSEVIGIWQAHIVYDWRWWLMTALLVLPWLFWFLWRKKDSTHRLLLAGLLVYLITSVLDSMGVMFGLWAYLVTPLPHLHAFNIPFDLSTLPVVTMFLIQIKPRMSPFWKALLYASALAFVAEPLLVAMDIYRQLEWKHLYSFPFYFLIYLAAHYISARAQFTPLNEEKPRR